MRKASLRPSNIVGNSHKQPCTNYNDFDVELKSVHNYLSTRIATATMVAAELNIYRPNLCRYKDMLIKQGVLAVVGISKCRITGFKAQYLTCCPEIIERVKG